ncbi:MAG: DUF2232 domain-containing protein [Desulfobacteraceae bacterium]|jgi:uncharacterized protein YybS (DUF2232 family)
MKITDVMGCTSPVILLLFASAWIPFIGPFFIFLIPLPFLYYATKLGLREGVKVAGLTLLIVGLIAKLAGYPQTMIFCFEFGLVGLILSEIYRRKYTLGFTMFWGTCATLIIGAIFLTIIALSQNMGPMEMILGYFQENLGATIRSYEESGLEPEKVAQLQEYGKILTDILAMIYPALSIVGSGLVVYIAVVLSKAVFRLGNIKYPDFAPMDQWQSHDFMVWGVIAAGFALFLSIGGIRFVAINGLIVMAVIYLFHGLAIVLFFFNKYTVPHWVRFGVYLLILFQQIFWIVLALAGLFDQWIDFRRIHKRARA